MRLQFSYKIDPCLTGPLGNLPTRISDFAGGPVRPINPAYRGPALSLLNLRRSNKSQLPSGQRVAQALGVGGDTAQPYQLKVRVPGAADGSWTFQDLPDGLLDRTPLWLFILAEAQRHIVSAWAAQSGGGSDIGEAPFFIEGVGAVTQLGPVGGRLLMETFYGVLDADPHSYRNAAPSSWKPLVSKDGLQGPVTFARMLLWTGLTLTDGFGA